MMNTYFYFDDEEYEKKAKKGPEETPEETPAPKGP